MPIRLRPSFVSRGIAVVAGADCSVTSLTAEQIQQIFTGEITDWSEVGGEEGAITLYTQDTTVGDTFAAFFSWRR